MTTKPKLALAMPLTILVVIGIWLTPQFSPVQPAQAQTPSPFLSVPFYGQETISQYFGGPNNHNGIDFSTVDYEPILASADGFVYFAGWYSDYSGCHQSAQQFVNGNDCGYGLHVIIRHPGNNNYRTLYGHMSSIASELRASGTGTYVRQGQVIGMSDHTGWSTGPHLHFEVRSDATTPVDPFNDNGVSLWLDDETALPNNLFPSKRPIPVLASGNAIIIDDSSSNVFGFSKGYGGLLNNPCTGTCTGRWTASTSGYGSDSYFAPADGNNTVDLWAKWQAEGAPSYGTLYQVFVHAPSIATKTWQAPYTLVDGDADPVQIKGQSVVDQFGLPGAGYGHSEWASIGTYFIHGGYYLYTTDATAETANGHCPPTFCNVGIDAVKFVRLGTTHLPDIRTSSSWVSSVVIRNNGGGTTQVRTAFYNASGVFICGNLYTPLRHETITVVPCANTTSGTVDSDQDVSVVVENLHSSGGATNSATNYTGLLPAGQGANPDWGQVGTPLYVPTIKYDRYGYTTDLYITVIAS